MDFQISDLPVNMNATKAVFNVGGQSNDVIVTQTFAVEGKVDQEVLGRAAAVTAEATACSDADTTLQSIIDQEVSDRTAAVSAEATARASADTTLLTNIDRDAAARAAAVTLEMTNRASEDTRIEAKVDKIFWIEPPLILQNQQLAAMLIKHSNSLSIPKAVVDKRSEC